MGWWKLEAERDDERDLTEDDIEEICRLIRDGMRSGEIDG